MTPVPIDLPLRPSEVAALAEIIYETVAGRPVTDDMRNRLSGRAGTLGLESVRAYFGSLQEDPAQNAAYYLAVDGLTAGDGAPLMLHMGPAAASGGGVLRAPLLIGRMRPGGEREIIVNAAPFGAEECELIAAYAEGAGRCFLPRPHGVMPALRVEMAEPARVAPAAFAAFRTIARTTGRNLAAILLPGGVGSFWATVWAAIRSGYREGYTAGGPCTEATAGLYTFFTAELEDLEELRRLCGGSGSELELDLRALPPEGIQETLAALQASGWAVHSVWIDAEREGLAQACAAVTAGGAIPAIRGGIPEGETAAAIRAATNGRLIYSTPFDAPDGERLKAILEALR